MIERRPRGALGGRSGEYRAADQRPRPARVAVCRPESLTDAGEESGIGDQQIEMDSEVRGKGLGGGEESRMREEEKGAKTTLSRNGSQQNICVNYSSSHFLIFTTNEDDRAEFVIKMHRPTDILE